MKGKIGFSIKNRHIEFQFTLEQSITILTGDSGTGKTKLIEMVSDYNANNKDSGVKLRCNHPCIALSGASWEIILKNTHDSIVFVDEGHKFMYSKEFADYVNGSDNYYVLITREALHQIPYGIHSIYHIVKNGRKPKFEKMYNDLSIKSISNFPYDLVIVEDSGSGLQFFQNATHPKGVMCITSNGKHNILNKLKENNTKQICVIADAVGLGAEVKVLVQYKNKVPVDFFLPESFEWLILKSKIYSGDKNIRDILISPVDYIDSNNPNREQFFYELLIHESHGKPKDLWYDKKTISSGYCQSANMNYILTAMEK